MRVISDSDGRASLPSGDFSTRIIYSHSRHHYAAGSRKRGHLGPPTSHPLPPTSREGLWLDRLFGLPPCREGTIHLQTSPEFQLRLYGTAVSVTNQNTEWMAKFKRWLLVVMNALKSSRWCGVVVWKGGGCPLVA
ncbi:hypothetical protein TNCV_3924821 [Trichonephila clavipes]|nr:hypothetical protein TNCV_3924821 [Trichonephila clavipes]